MEPPPLPPPRDDDRPPTADGGGVEADEESSDLNHFWKKDFRSTVPDLLRGVGGVGGAVAAAVVLDAAVDIEDVLPPAE